MCPNSGEVALPPGSKIRFQALDPNLGSGHVWEIKTKTETGDIYVETKSAGKWIHISYHQSGEWHYTLDWQARLRTPESDRHFGVTFSRDDVISGYKHALRIAVLTNDLMAYGVTPDVDNIIKVPFKPGVEGICMDMFISESNAPVIRIEDAFLIAKMEMGDGKTAYIFARPYRLLDTPQSAFPEIIRAAQEDVSASNRNGDQTSIVIGCAPEDTVGYMMQIEARIFD
jgi:hypothetical protein